MGLSSDLISQFVKATSEKKESKKETTAYGVIKVDGDGSKYVQLDGSDISTPVTTAVTVKEGDRVMVMIKNHTATVTGNLSSPSVGTGEMGSTLDEIAKFEILISEDLRAKQADIDTLKADNVTINKTLTAYEADIHNLEADNVKIHETLTANDADIKNLKAEKLDATVANATFATIKNLEATNAYIYNLEGAYGKFVDLTTENFKSVNATIENLDTKYADIEFANIGKAAMETFYAKSGLIENVVVSDGTVTGRLVGVTIAGDLIEGNTIVAEKLLIKGEDGLYYKLNTDGETIESEQTDYNSLNGQIIMAKSVTAEKISVDDLVAFGATIGGFNITSSSIYSEIKDTEDNTIRGIYMDTDGQFNFGDESNFIKYYQDEDGTYKLAISAASILYALNGKLHSIEDLGVFGEYVRIGMFEDEPCIELGEADSDFKLIITNTRILFTEGTAVPAHINNQSLHITKAVIEEEIQQGKFVWKVRQNGNMGLVWKGGAS